MTTSLHGHTAELRYAEVSLSEVLKYYAQDFSVPDDGKITRVDYFIDPVKEVVVFKVYVNMPPVVAP